MKKKTFKAIKLTVRIYGTSSIILFYFFSYLETGRERLLQLLGLLLVGDLQGVQEPGATYLGGGS